MNKDLVYNPMTEFLNQAAYNCLRGGRQFLIFNDKIYFVSKKLAFVDRLGDDSLMEVLEETTIHRTDFTEKDLIGESWARPKEGMSFQ
jgi:hypothetical protein